VASAFSFAHNTVRALVTGGAGFIGSNIVSALVARGDSVTILDDLSSGYAGNISREARFIHGSVLDADAVGLAATDCDVVFHAAASVGNARSLQDPVKDCQTNALGTINILEAARRNEISKLVYSSSAAVYGDVIALPVSEHGSPNPLTPYAVSKLAGENYVMAYSAMYGFHNVALRYFNVFGQGQRYDAYGNVVPIFCTLALAGKPITVYGDGKQTRDFVNVRDVVQANLRAADLKQVSGIFNVGVGRPVSVLDLVEELSVVLGVHLEIKRSEPRVGDVRHSFADISSTEKILGYAPSTSLRGGLTEYVDWLRQDVVQTSA
jgi:UDP-glucose 4-epimerase